MTRLDRFHNTVVPLNTVCTSVGDISDYEMECDVGDSGDDAIRGI